MNTSTDQPSLAETPVDEAQYKPDLELSDRYQQFSSELLRLALLGMAGIGFLISDVVLSKEHPLYLAMLRDARWFLVVSIICLSLAVGGALAHRYLATDCISDEIHFLRELKRSGRDTARRVHGFFRWKLKVCAWLLMATCGLLFAGAAFAAASFSVVLF
ncbi:MAG: hypothetical protein DWH91_04170 [Planctomycetota bacterium]|nr:MAG: hypothetical protein DWH91_04170 [Planctomycetota bacterium]